MSHDLNPLISPAPEEIPLQKAPLVRVITQVRFSPAIVAIEKRDLIAPFQEAIGGEYPILQPEQTQALIFGPQGVASAQNTQVTWRFRDIEGKWRVSLAPEFVALETTAYNSREDFFKKMEVVVQALSQHFKPRAITRLGVRYIDRITGEELSRLSTFIKKEVLGVMGTCLADNQVHALNDVFYKVVEGNLHVRWGRFPAKAIIDPSAIEPVDEPCWLLDIDAFSEESKKFDASSIVENAVGFSRRIYSFFRWAVTDDFLKFYGGKI